MDRPSRRLERAGDVLARITGPLDRRGRVTAVRVMDVWETVAGEEIASRTTRMAFARGELTVSVESHAWATELGALSEELRHQVNSVLGENVVKRMRFTVSGGRYDERAPRRLAANESAGEPREMIRQGLLSAEETAAIERSAAGIADDELRAIAIRAAKRGLESEKTQNANIARQEANGEPTDPKTGLVP